MKTYCDTLKERIETLTLENYKLRKIAYKTFDQIQEERKLEIYSATSHVDALLLLMELREDSTLSYEDLRAKISEPNKLYRRIADLIAIHFIEEKAGNFCLRTEAKAFLSKRGL